MSTGSLSTSAYGQHGCPVIATVGHQNLQRKKSVVQLNIDNLILSVNSEVYNSFMLFIYAIPSGGLDL